MGILFNPLLLLDYIFDPLNRLLNLDRSASVVEALIVTALIFLLYHKLKGKDKETNDLYGRILLLILFVAFIMFIGYVFGILAKYH